MHFSHRHLAWCLITATFVALLVCTPGSVMAQVWQGGDVQSGLPDAEAVELGGTGDIRETVSNILIQFISLVGLAATTIIIIAGMILVVAGANPEMQQRARRMILYTLIAILIISLAAAFVMFIIEAGTGS